MKYITWLHILSFVVASYVSYLGFMWFTNFVNFGWTQYSITEAHRSVLFYLCITLTVTFCLALDFFFETYGVLINMSPISFLRIAISRAMDMENPFNALAF